MKKLLISIIILSLVIPLSAQLNFTNYANVNEIAVLAEEGNYIWIGTNGGLFKRNKSTGALVSKFTSEDGLVFNEVKAITIDQLGNKWIGTTHGVSYYDGITFTNYYQQDGLYSNGVYDIVIDLSGNVWFQCSNGITMYDGTTWTTVLTTSGDLTMDVAGNIWVGSGSTSYGLYKIDDGVITEYNEANSDIAYNGIMCVASDNDGNILVGHGNNNQVSIFDGENWSYITGVGWYIYDIQVDVLGQKWIAYCCGNSLKLYDADNVLLETYGTGDGLINQWISDILIDDQGNKWFGTHAGLSRFDDSNWSSFYIPHGLGENDIMGMDLHPDGSAWFSTMNGIYIFDDDNWSHHEDLDLSNNETYDVWIDSPTNVWVGTSTGASHYNGSIWTGYTNSSTGGELADDYVYSVAVDFNGVTWFGTHSGLSLTDGFSWLNLLPGQWIHDIFIDDYNNIWVATHGNGVHMFPPAGYAPPTLRSA